MPIITKKDLNQLITSTITEYISKNYTVNHSTIMGADSDDINNVPWKMNLFNRQNKSITRIILNKDNLYHKNGRRVEKVNIVKLQVLKFSGIKCNTSNLDLIFKTPEILSDLMLYSLKNECYVDNLDELYKYKEIANNRRKDRITSVDKLLYYVLDKSKLSRNLLISNMDRINSTRGFKRLHQILSHRYSYQDCHTLTDYQRGFLMSIMTNMSILNTGNNSLSILTIKS